MPQLNVSYPTEFPGPYNTLQKVNKIYHITLTVPPHYLVKLLEPAVHNFRRKSSNVRICQFFGRKFFYQFSSNKTFTFSGFFYKKNV